MKCYPNRFGTKLLNIPSTGQVNVTTDGTGYRVLPDQSDGQTDAAQDYKVVTSMNVAGGTSPTAQIFIQGSLDGSTWIDLARGTQRQAAGSFREILDPAVNSPRVILDAIFYVVRSGGHRSQVKSYALCPAVGSGCRRGKPGYLGTARRRRVPPRLGLRRVVGHAPSRYPVKPAPGLFFERL